MNEQLSLFDILAPAPKPPQPAVRLRSAQAYRRGGHTLFFGAVPPPRVRDGIDARWQELSGALGLQSAYRHATLHMSLLRLGHMASIDSRFVDAFCEAADGVTQAPFELVFTQAESFGGDALVLTTAEGKSEPVQALAQALCRSLRAVGLAAPDHLPVIRPHITLTYGPRIAKRPVPPLHWTVNSFSLIDSVIGRGLHNTLGHWSLRG